MGNKRVLERKLQLSELKHQVQERKSRKKELKGLREDDVSSILKRMSREMESCLIDENGKWNIYENGTPTPRAHCSFTMTTGGIAIMFGGELFDGLNLTLYNDTFSYNIIKREWKILVTSYKPLPRCSHQAVYYNNRIYIFGGEYSTFHQFHHFNDMYYLCLKTLRWYKVDVIGNVPTPRSGHRMVLWNSYWLLFGGFFDDGKSVKYYNDLYLFNFKESKWILINQDRFVNSLPSPRSSCLLVLQTSSNNVLMYGGFIKSKDTIRNVLGTCYNDSWIINMNAVLDNNGSILVWQSINTINKPKISTGFGYSTHRNFAVIFGGVDDVDEGGLSLKSTFHNSCYLLNVDQRKWYPLTINCVHNEELTDCINKVTLSPTIPIARMYSYVAVYNNTLLIGGGIIEDGSIEITLSDLWSMDLIKRDGWECIFKGHSFNEIWKGEDSEEGSSDEGGSSEGSSERSEDEEEESDEDDEDEEEGVSIDDDSSSSSLSSSSLHSSELASSLCSEHRPSTTHPRVLEGERLSDYYNRTRKYWLNECKRINGLNDNDTIDKGTTDIDKKLKADAFESCRQHFNRN